MQSRIGWTGWGGHAAAVNTERQKGTSGDGFVGFGDGLGGHRWRASSPSPPPVHRRTGLSNRDFRHGLMSIIIAGGGFLLSLNRRADQPTPVPMRVNV
jgi:hypothetical protein